MKMMDVNKDKELLDILKSVGMTDDEIKQGILNGNIKMGETLLKSEDEKEEAEEKEDEGKEEVDETKKEDKDDNVEKSNYTDLIKSMEDKLASYETKVGEYEAKLSSIEALMAENAELQKSVNALSETVNRIANVAPQPKSVQGFSIIEKSAGSFVDNEERQVISLSTQREELGDALIKAMDAESDPIMKSAIENDIVNVSAGSGVPSPAVANHLYKNHKIRIVN